MQETLNVGCSGLADIGNLTIDGSAQALDQTTRLVFEALVFPHLTYCCTVWGGCSTVHRNRLQKVINFAARIVTGLKRREHVTPALEALGWPRFDGILKERDIALIRKLTSDDVPPALSHIVLRRSDVSERSTRCTDRDLLELPKIRTERARRHFPFRSITSWNCEHRMKKPRQGDIV